MLFGGSLLQQGRRIFDFMYMAFSRFFLCGSAALPSLACSVMKAPCATQLRKSQTPMAHTLQLSVHARRLVTDGRAARWSRRA